MFVQRLMLTKNNMLRVFFLTYISILMCTIKSIEAQDFARYGLPFSTHVKEICKGAGIKTWVIAQAPNGYMYLGNGYGVVEHNGTSSNLYRISNGSVIRSLYIDTTGRIYVGATNEFGYFEADKYGILQYTCLTNKFKVKDVGIIWDIFEHEGSTYFVSYQNALYKYSNNWVTQINLPPTFSRFKGFRIAEQLLLFDQNAGLATLKNDTIYRYHHETFSQDVLAYALMPLDSLKILLATRLKGLYAINITQLKPLSYEESFKKATTRAEFDSLKNSNSDFFYRQFQTPLNPELAFNEIYYAQTLPNNQYCISTLKGGAYIMDKQGKMLDNYRLNNGLPDNSVSYSFLDREYNLWLAHYHGLSILGINEGLRTFGAESGIKGIIMNSLRIGEKIFIGTTSGLYMIDQTQMNTIPKEIGTGDIFVRYIYKYEHDGTSDIIFGTLLQSYFYDIKKNEITQISLPNASYLIIQHPSDNTIFFSCHINGIDILQKKDPKSWKMSKIANILPNIFGINKLDFNSTGRMFISTSYSGLLTVDIPNINDTSQIKVTEYTTRNGLPQEDKNRWVLHDQYVYAITGNGIYLPESNDSIGNPNMRFIPCNEMNKLLNSRGYINDIVFENDNIIIGTSEGLLLYNKTDRAIKDTSFYRLNNMRINDITLDSTCNWYENDEQLIYQDKTNVAHETSDIDLLFTQIQIGEHQLSSFFEEHNIYAGQFSFNDNSVFVRVTSPSFCNIGNNRYSFFMEGFDSIWSEWSFDNHVNYRYLTEGNYTLLVKSINGIGLESNMASIHFSILPPWYQAWYAWTAYIILTITILYRIIKLHTKKLFKDKRKLETIIKTSISTVELQKEEIQQQRDSLFKQHREMTNSIEYAKHIQKAIFLPTHYLSELYPSSFVFNKPKDIVSGDFLWVYSADNYTVIVVSDCTGHGVPGAFMSIIGASFLKEIVISQGNYMPDLILDQLRNNIIKTLHQTTDPNDNKDGMDVAIITIDNKAQTVYYAGANSPVFFLYKNAEIVRLQPDRMPVGVYYTIKPFTLHTFPISEIDSIYMLSDGYLDQFGEKIGRKLTSKRFVEVLSNIQHLAMQQQKEFLKAYFDNWRRDIEQTDDVLVVGFKLEKE